MEELAVIHSFHGDFGPALICLFCVPMVLRLVYLVRRSVGFAKRANLWVTIVLLGSTVWAAHLTYIQSHIAAEARQFDLYRVAGMFVLTVSGTAIATWIAHAHRSFFVQIACGAVFGLTAASALIFGLSTPLMSYSLLISPLGALTLAMTGFAAGAIGTAFFRLKKIRNSWKVGSFFVVVVILLPQFVLHTMTLSPSNAASAIRFMGVGSDVVTVLGFATVAVCLFWALAAFVAEAHEASIRKSLLRDATLIDALTELPNRLRLEQHFATLRGRGSLRAVNPAALLLFNIEGFKIFNEQYGTSFGDFVLKEIASRISLQSGPSFFVARLGADEFVAVFDNVRERSVVEEFAMETRALLCQPISQGRIDIRPEVYVGYAMLPQDDVSFDGLLVKAEVALSNARGNPVGRVQGFDPEMNQQEGERAAMLQELRDAIDRGEMYLRYQMQNDIASEDLLGFEVLLRWKHPELGQVSPGVFIPLAERSGQIKMIGMWVLERACEEAAKWHRPFSVAVNVAPQQLLEPGFAKAVGEVLGRTNMPASRLELEITEASIIEDETNTLAVMHQLRAMGIRIAMDDFGTGYSSLAMLQKFPFDKIKIDRSFVIDVHENPERAAIIEATVLIGNAMSIPILVEGVENRDELTFLRRAKCNIIQGFIFGQPLSIDQVRELATIPDEHRRIWY